MKYEDGIIVNKERPLNPQTSPNQKNKVREEVNKRETYQDFEDDKEKVIVKDTKVTVHI